MSQQDFFLYSAEHCANDALYPYEQEVFYIDHDVELRQSFDL